jgi:thiamine-phosphate pyrophosphorylase
LAASLDFGELSRAATRVPLRHIIKGQMEPPALEILRILDANANRAREALRVLEDYARFILNSQPLTQTAKSLRHDLTTTLQQYISEALPHRDTPADVGAAIKTTTEKSRPDIAAVVIAAGKRAAEALRTMEEFLKIPSQADAAKIESLRYRLYDLEQKLSATLRPANLLAEVRLYVLITESLCKHPWLRTAESAIDGGADCLQLREKNLPDDELLRRAKSLTDLCHRRGVLCIINDRPDIALLSGADGVHLGQDDLPIPQARKILGMRKIIGLSTHNLQQAQAAVEAGADYIGVGPIFKSSTKSRDFLPGLEYAAAAANRISIPRFAIAGITLENVRQVLETGIRAVAVTAAVIGADDVAAAAKKMKEALLRR